MQIKFTPILAALALGFSTAGIASDYTFDDFDHDGDGYITTGNFYGSAADWGLYADYDLDNDGLFNEDEWNEFGWDYDFATWDANEDGYLHSGEFYDGVYNTYDANDDGYWEEDEWDAAVDDGLFDW